MRTPPAPRSSSPVAFARTPPAPAPPRRPALLVAVGVLAVGVLAFNLLWAPPTVAQNASAPARHGGRMFRDITRFGADTDARGAVIAADGTRSCRCVPGQGAQRRSLHRGAPGRPAGATRIPRCTRAQRSNAGGDSGQAPLFPLANSIANAIYDEEPSRGAAAQAVVFEVSDGETRRWRGPGGRRRRVWCRGRLCRRPHQQPTKTQPRLYPRPGLLGPGLLTPGGFRVNDTSPRPRVKHTRHAMGASRVIAYIDGFNLYHGLRDARLKNSRWLDIHGMCVSLLKPGERLELVRYFTSWVKDSPAKAARQAVYIDALRASGGIEARHARTQQRLRALRSQRPPAGDVSPARNVQEAAVVFEEDRRRRGAGPRRVWRVSLRRTNQRHSPDTGLMARAHPGG